MKAIPELTAESIHDVIDVVTPDGRSMKVVLRGNGPTHGVLLLLPAGLKYSIGPHRLNVKLARELADLGLLAAFVDPSGYGDSDGRLPAGTITEVCRNIEAGALVDDILVVARHLRAKYPNIPFYISGLCGGAVTACLAAARAPGLFQGIISFSLAVQVTPVGGGPVPLHSPTFTQNLVADYARRAFSATAWRRLVSGEASFIGPFRAIMAMIRHKIRPSTVSAIPGLNLQLRAALRTLAVQGLPQLMIFGGSDRRYHEFVDASSRELWDGNAISASCRVAVVSDANHEFHFREWQIEAFRIVREWVADLATSGRDIRA